MIALTIFSSLFDLGLMVSLAFVLAFGALFSLLVVRFVKESSIKVELRPNKQRLFKRDLFSVNSIFSASGGRWVSVKFSGLKPPAGVETRVEQSDKESLRISIEPNFAGRFRGMEISTEISDPLDLFKKEVKIPFEDFTIDSLPLSLAFTIPKARVSSLSLGEVSAKFSGGDVELYALDEYRPFGETKNILWKRVARMPDEKLVVRVRESNIPETVKIGVIHRQGRRELEDRLLLMDRVCEAIGLLGNNLLALGCQVQLVYASLENPDRITSGSASDIDELSDILMGMWNAPSERLSEEDIVEISLLSDIIVTGFSEMQDRELARLVSKKLSLLIKERSPPPLLLGEKSFVYSGTEDLRKLALKVAGM